MRAMMLARSAKTRDLEKPPARADSITLSQLGVTRKMVTSDFMDNPDFEERGKKRLLAHRTIKILSTLSI
jgi:hypothetical protein